MRSKLLAAAALAVATTLGASGVAFAAGNSPTTTSPTNKKACDTDAHWPAYAQGSPDAFDAHDDGVYLWHNPTGGWGLRVSHPILPGRADHVVFSGTIVSKGKIGDLKRVRDERDDKVKVSHHDHVLAFRFVNYGGVDGVDLTTTCTPGLRVNLRVDSATMQPRFVHLGDKKVSPESDPFAIRHRDTDTSTVPASPTGQRHAQAARSR